MAPRAARAALAFVIASAGTPAAAQAIARSVAVYPFPRSDGSAGEDAQGLLESALRRVVNRSDDVVLSEPILTRAACGPAATAPVECLARLAGNGLVLRAVLHRSERSAAIAIDAIDGAAGKAVGPVTVGVDLYIQNAEPLARALGMLLDDVRAAARRQAGGMPRPAVVAPPLVPGTPPRAEARAEASKPPPPSRDLHVEEPAPDGKAPAATATRAAPKRPWLRSAAPWCAGAGLALLAGAAAVAIANESLADELDRKYHDGTLTPADAASYDKVEQYNTLTIALAAAGGALTLTSAYLFTIVPSQGGASVALAGRF
ncbi:MAG TPA: hypothetical protein VFL83_09565 [Anaeromyxobacter sp.]|nr:hypothetical protein [Anaeromyxobacter sp.]